MNIFNVLSFDPERIKLDIIEQGRIAVRKITSLSEYRNIVRAHEHIVKHPIELKLGALKLSLSPVPIVRWERDNSVLVTEFIEGDNLEHILRDPDHAERKEWIALIRQLYGELRLSGFLWGDFAPRNMIFRRDDQRIFIVDFEREQVFRDSAIIEVFFSRYVRNYSREEFSCFLLREEQKFLFEEFLTREAQGYIPVSEIPYGRKKTLLALLFGSKEAYSVEEVEETEDIMASTATPFFVEDVLFYPMDILDRVGCKGGHVVYANVVKQIKDLEEKEKFDELSKIAKHYR